MYLFNLFDLFLKYKIKILTAGATCFIFSQIIKRKQMNRVEYVIILLKIDLLV